MNQLLVVVLLVAVVALGIVQAVLMRRVDALRGRAKRSLLIGPESFLRLQKQLYDHVVQEDFRRRGRAPALPLEFRAEWGEDTLLFDLFRDVESGVYIEVGALDGKRNSVTWVFEAMGWTGLLVEPIPERFAECRANRPGSLVLHAALGPAGAKGTTSFLIPDDLDQQLSAYRQHEGMVDRHIEALDQAGAKMRKVEVPFMSMDAALEQGGGRFKRVDFASIDVEGGEMDVLRGFSLDTYRPRVLVIEDLTLGEDSRVAQFVIAKGYTQVLWIGPNRVYVRNDEPAMLDRAKRLAETVYSPLVPPRGHANTASHTVRQP